MNITTNGSQNFNGLFYRIKDNNNKTRGYILGSTHTALFCEGAKIPKKFSESVMKRFAKISSLIVELNVLQNPNAAENSKASFSMDYELLQKASKENKEIRELETVEFQASMIKRYIEDRNQELIKRAERIRARICDSGSNEKIDLFREKVKQWTEYRKKADVLAKKVECKGLSLQDDAQLWNLRMELGEQICLLEIEIEELQNDPEIISFNKKFESIKNEEDQALNEFMRRPYEASDEGEIEKFIKFCSSPEFAKEFWDDRNVEMSNKVDTWLKTEGRHFIAPGFGHLVGKRGLVALLSEKGWNIERIKCDCLIF